MKLNMHLILDGLDTISIPTRSNLRFSFEDLYLSYVALYDSHLIIDRQVLYIIEASDFNSLALSTVGSFIVIGKPNEKMFESPTLNFIVVSDFLSERIVLLYVQRIFDKYNTWESDIVDLAQGSGSLDDIIKRSVPIFQNALLVHDQMFRTISFHQAQSEFSPKSQDGSVAVGGFFSVNHLSDFMQTAKENNEEDPFGYTEPHFWRSKGKPRILASNIVMNDGAIIRVVVAGKISNKPARDIDYPLLVKLSSVLSSVRSAYLVTTQEWHLNNFQLIIDDILKGSHVSRKRLAEVCGAYNWNPDDTFTCIELRARDGNYHAIPFFRQSHALQADLKASISNCLPLAQLDNMLIHNSTRSNYSFDELKARLLDYAKKRDLIIGIGPKFKSLPDIKKTFEPTRKTIDIGMKKDPSLFVYCFIDCRFDYLLDLLTEIVPQEVIVPGAIYDIIEYDRENNTDLLPTLRAYLDNNCSVTKSCNQLYIHQSTFKYRLSKIKSLLTIDLDDRDNRLLLSIAFKALDAYELAQHALSSTHAPLEKA